MTIKGMRSLLAIGAALVAAGIAQAGEIIGPVIQLGWSSGDSSGSWTLEYNPELYDEETGWYRWALDEPVTLFNDADEEVATINNMSININVDPIIALNYAVTAGAAPVNFTISSALVAFAPINNGQIAASAQMGMTDNNGDGGTLTTNFGGKGYMANYNGAGPVPAGTNYASLVSGFSVGVFGSNNVSEGNPPGGGLNPFVGAISTMASAFSFGVTAQDSSTGTSIYVVTPEPASMMLLGLGALALIRRR